ncbi:hypothetical protein ACQ4M3_05550 [Leptolyngbya sp. AN03gr2]|uniref:hypothetical protein n=1 Tax=unclassified Leptolyngbya TaxID=2650499 RepID=UPI003D31BAAB
MLTLRQPKFSALKWKKIYRYVAISVGSGIAISVVAGSAIALDLGDVQSTVNRVGGALGSAGLPVQGTVTDINNTLGEINQYFQQLQELYSLISSGNLRGLLGSLDGVIGELGIPDPDATQNAVWSEQIGNTNGNPTTGGQPNSTASSSSVRPDVAQSVNRNIAQSITASVLSKAGQQKLIQGQQEITGYIRQSEQLATDAQSKTVTQDVIKNLTQQQKLEAQLQGHLSTQLTQLEVGQAATNLQLTSIDSGVGQLNQTQQSELERQTAAIAQSGSNIYIPGLYTTK